jgi:plasmid stabilization system protein ParE
MPAEYAQRISSGAEAEIAETVEYIAGISSPATALRWLEGLEATFHSLCDMPERFPFAREAEHFPQATLRRCLYHKHRVLFVVEERTIWVLHVRHGYLDELGSTS